MGFLRLTSYEGHVVLVSISHMMALVRDAVTDGGGVVYGTRIILQDRERSVLVKENLDDISALLERISIGDKH